MKRNKSIFLLNDMEIENTIFPLINNTITPFGEEQLKKQLTTFSTKHDVLNLTNIVKFLHENKNYTSLFEKELRFIKSHEKIINNWLLYPRDHELEFYMGLSYETNIFGCKIDLFNNPITLTLSNALRFSTVLIQIIFYIVMYKMMQYIGNDLTVQEYIWSLILGYYTSAKFFLSFLIPHKTVADYVARIGAGTYVLYMIYSIYETIISCLKHYEKCENFVDDYVDLTRTIRSCKNIFDHDELKYLYMTDKEINSIKDSFRKLRKHFHEEKILGETIVESINYLEISTPLSNVLNYIGKIDAYISTSKLLDKGYSSPLVDLREKPYIHGTKLWNPLLNYNDQIKNDVTLGLCENRTMILTGPNKAGKSTYMRTVILTIYLAQSLGVTCAETLYYSPFDHIFTYLNVPDEIGKESLFEAELERCYNYYETMIDFENDKVIGFMDELFTGTNYLEGMAGSYSIIKKISEQKNAITMVTTHFHEICNITNISYNKFCANVKDQDKLQNGESMYEFTYKIEPGISDQCIALNLLREKGYGDDIIKTAVKKLEEVKNRK